MVSFLSAAARSMGLEVATHQLAAGKPILVLTWRGLEPGLASVLLNSHMDVVPVFPEHWTHPPFAAHKVTARAVTKVSQPLISLRNITSHEKVDYKNLSCCLHRQIDISTF